MKKHFDQLIQRAIASAVAAMAIFTGVARAEGGHGFLNVVNLVPGVVPCKVDINKDEAMPGGLRSAQSTGWGILPVGNYTLDLKIEGYANASGSIELVDGKGVLCVVFLQASPGLDSQGKPIRPRIRFKLCETLPEGKGFSLSFMSFCPEETGFLIGAKPLTIKFLEIIEIPNWSGGGFTISRNQTEVGKVTTQREKGAFYVLVGTDHQGSYCSTLVRAEKLTLPHWMNKTPSKQ